MSIHHQLHRSLAPRVLNTMPSLSTLAFSTLLTLTSSFSTSNTNMSSSPKLSQELPSSSSSSSSSLQKSHPLSPITDNFSYSWLEQLTPETRPNGKTSDNKTKRPVKNGHYVPVLPTPLTDPRLVTYSPTLAADLGLTEEQIRSPAFLRYFSGDVVAAVDDDVPNVRTWATPYALSIMGKRYTSNCPFGTGEGYGDGRAISVGEIWIPHSPTDDDDDDDDDKKDTTPRNESHGTRYEFQMKGAGTTPFCRGADGRAVLRSSIREFLASESMHHLGISTTRALSLISSDSDTTSRPWYSSTNNNASPLPSLDDPRLAMYPMEQRKAILLMLKNRKQDPNIMISEPLAITTRVARSFCRIGHVDLFARRAVKAAMEGRFEESEEYGALEEMLWHVCFREFYEEAYEPFYAKNDLEGCVVKMLERSAEGLADMVAGWIRVGFCQGNFNGDNCLVAGRTMDYGPFGFMDEYNPLFAKWTGSGEHFGFLNQPTAGLVNYMVLVESALQVLRRADESEDERLDELQKMFIGRAKGVFKDRIDAVWNVKMGFSPESSKGPHLWDSLEPLLRDTRADWTLFWRQLSYVARDFDDLESTDYDKMMVTLIGDNQYSLSSPFHAPLTSEQKKAVTDWITSWRDALRDDDKSLSSSSSSSMTPADRMMSNNPKYTLREWILVEAYTEAAKGNYDVIHELNKLITKPYDEGSDVEHERYYRRAKEEDLMRGGTAFMS